MHLPLENQANQGEHSKQSKITDGVISGGYGINGILMHYQYLV